MCICGSSKAGWSRRFNTEGNFVHINPQKVSETEIMKANNILIEKYPLSAPFLTFSYVEWYCRVRKAYQQHQMFFHYALRPGFIKRISEVSEGKLST